MNQIILFSRDLELQDKEDGTKTFFVSKDDERYQHCKEILKIKLDDKIRICYENHGIGEGIIQDFSEDKLVISIENEKKLNIHSNQHHLVLGLSRPQSLKKIFEYIATIGLKKLTILPLRKSDLSFLKSKTLKKENYEKFLYQGLSQSAYYSCIPEIEIIREKNQLQKILEVSQREKNKMVFLHPRKEEGKKDKSFSPFSSDLLKEENLQIFIGPEGGFIENEIASFEAMKISKLILSPTILRVEQAVTHFFALSHFFSLGSS